MRSLLPGIHGRPGAVQSAVGATTCYSQGLELDGYGISSQNFGSGYANYTDLAADDFVLTKTCRVRTVIVSGQYSDEGGPAASENVTFYRDAGGFPGAVKKTYTIQGTDSAGSFTINLGKGIKLRSGTTYWLSVQTNQQFAFSGEWSWDTALDGAGVDAQWQNPGDGFGTGCYSWCDAKTAGWSNPNLSFSLSSQRSRG